MNIHVLDQTFKDIYVIDSYISVIWTRRYYSYGDCELYLSAEKEILDVLQCGYYLVREQDIKSTGLYNVMIINSREIQTDAENGDNLTVKGWCLKSILKRRVIIDQTVLQGTIQACLHSLIDQNIINPTNASRQISNFTLGTDTFTDDTKVKMQITGKNLAEAFEEICLSYGIGYDVYLYNGNFVFYLYKGLDRSYAQNVNAHVVVSEAFDNLLSSDYEQNNTEFANVAIVAGEGEGNARKKVTVGTASGLERYEMWVDARNASSNDGEIAEAQYLAMLATDGQDALSEAKATIVLSGEIINGVSFIINKDYFLGDVIQFENNYGISAATRVIEVIESDDDTGENIIPTFSDMEV